MTLLYVHYQATKGIEPYLLSLDAETGSNRFTCLVRPAVTVALPVGMKERELAREGLEPRMVIPWLAQMAKTTRTVVVYDRDRFLRVMDCEMQRLGRSEWVRPGIEIVDLSEKATPIARIETENGFRKPTLEEASMTILTKNADGLNTIKALYDHREIKQLCEVA